MSKITIAIDGYSSCGKSTLAKALAAKLNYAYLDSGAMYRCVTLHCIRKGIIVDKKFEKQDVIAVLPEISLSFQFNPHTRTSETFMNGENVEKEIRTMPVAENVSKISTIKEVREHLVHIQRELGKNKGVVMDGRDIGSHVFPDAELKIFMTADTDVRTQRRQDELWSKGQHVEFNTVKINLMQRDYDDTHRKESPLIRAKDAIVLDNTDLNKEEQLEYVLKLISDQKLTRETLV
jgi:CMP/dCMP kinase